MIKLFIIRLSNLNLKAVMLIKAIVNDKITGKYL